MMYLHLILDMMVEYNYNPDEDIYYSDNSFVLYLTTEDGIFSACFDNLNAGLKGLL